MTMLKGYTTPNPNSNDGDYGAYGNCAGCESRSMGGFSASPAEVPYWEGQGIARTIPALNGFGLATASQIESLQVQTEQMTGEPLDLKMLGGAALLGWFFGGKTGALIGAGVGFVYGKKIRSMATSVDSIMTRVTDPSVAGFGLIAHDRAERDQGGKVNRGARRRTLIPGANRWYDGFGNEIVMMPKGESCPPKSEQWCSEYRYQAPTGSTIPPIKVSTVVDLITGSHPATTIGPTSTGPGPNVVPFQPPAPGNSPPPPGEYVQQEAPLDVTMIGGAAVVGYLFKGATGAVIGAAIAAYLGRGRDDVNLVPA